MQTQGLKKGIYILPNLFTSMNLFCGYYAVLSAIHGKFFEAAVAIIIGAAFDLLDGKIARATHTTSRFGMEYDSLADLLTFGLAPAVLMVLWVLAPMGRPGWLAGFLFTACGALRLARFNVTTGAGPDFEGLPIPAAAAMVVAVVMVCLHLGIDPEPFRVAMLVMMFGLSFCMVSSFRYKSLKKVALFKRLGFNTLVCLVLILVAVAAEPVIILFTGVLVYVVSGPVLSLIDVSTQASGSASRTGKEKE